MSSVKALAEEHILAAPNGVEIEYPQAHAHHLKSDTAGDVDVFANVKGSFQDMIDSIMLV